MKPFETVVREHGPLVLRVCRASLGPVDADDAWSETFLSALRAYPELPSGADVAAWLVTIAHRKAIDVHRRRARLPAPVDTLPEPAAAAGGPTGPAGPAGPTGAVEDRIDLYAALAALPRKQRLCVAYHHLGGLPHREVARLVGGSEAAARRSAADGMAALRRHLAPPVLDPPALDPPALSPPALAEDAPHPPVAQEVAP